MKRIHARVLIVLAGTLALAGAAFAQNETVRSAAGDQYVISAKAGGVNFTEGKVSVFRKSGRSGYLLKGDSLEIGDRVTTSEGGKAEVLLNPGSYLRVGGSTAFEFLTTDLDDLRLNLKAGSAVFEVIADNDFKVTILMPRTAMALTRSGVYRIDIEPDGRSKVSVWKGKMFVGAENKTTVKAGRSATVAGVNAEVAKFDRDEKDSLDTWSKDRAKELARVNSRLERNVLRNTLLNSFNRRGWDFYGSFGLWVFDPFRSSWCFLPFGSGWGSPYGYGYGYDIWNIRMPRWIYYQRPTSPNPGTTTGQQPVERRGVRPPFRNIEDSSRGSGEGVVRPKVDPQFDDGPIMPRSFPTRPSSAPSSSAPASTIPQMGGGGERKGRP